MVCGPKTVHVALERHEHQMRIAVYPDHAVATWQLLRPHSKDERPQHLN